MSYSTEILKKLREQTNVSVMACKKALDEAAGDYNAACEILRKESELVALKKSERETKAGVIDSYIHSNKKIGVLVELKSETDFVANTNEFQKLAHDIAMHIAAYNPQTSEELFNQEYIRDPGTTVEATLKEAIQKFGEKIEISRFERFSL